MNIIWITTQFPRNKKDTKGIFIYRTVKELSKFYSINVIALRPITFPILEILKHPLEIKFILSHFILNFRITKHWEDTKVKVTNIKYIRFLRGPLLFTEGYIAYWAARNKIKKLLKKDSIIHANWIFPEGKLAYLVNGKFNNSYVLTIRGGDINRLKVNSSNWNHAKSVFNRASRITSVSIDLIDKCREKKIVIPDSKVAITHNYYEVNKFNIIDQKECSIKNKLSNKKIIFFVGGLIPRKNVRILIIAVSELLKKYSNLNLLIAGDGVEERKLKQLVSELNVNEHITFLNRIEPNKVVEYMNASDVFCLPSKSEGLPNVVVEALLCGVPVVASAVNELPYIIKDGKNGFLVDPNSKEEIITAIDKTLSRTWDRNKLRESIADLFPEKFREKYAKLYRNIN